MTAKFFINLLADGTLSADATINANAELAIMAEMYNVLDSEVSLDVSFRKTNNSAITPSNITCKLTFKDDLTGDLVYQVEGTLSNDEDDTSSLISRLFSAGLVADAEIKTDTDFDDAIAATYSFNNYASLGNLVKNLTLPAFSLPTFNEETHFQAIINAENPPSYLALPDVTDAQINTVMLRAMDKLNIPLIAEMDSADTVNDVITNAASLGIAADEHRVQLIWNPNVARPRDAVGLRGRKKPFGIIGTYLGKLLERNSRLDAQGVPPLHIAIAGADYPFNFRGMEQNPSITLDEDALERLAVAKINVVRRQRYNIGTFFTMSDALTSYQHASSALRLFNAADIICYTENQIIDITHRHLLKPTSMYLEQAGRDIKRFLDACVGAGLLKPAQDLGGQPYTFKLTPDENYPFERVRIDFSRRPEGLTRAVSFSSVVVK